MQLRGPNPYKWARRWFWDDERNVLHGPYDNYLDALRAVLQYSAWQPPKVASKPSLRGA